MSFANPTAWFWAILIVPVIVCYILRVRPRIVRISTVMFWDEIVPEKKHQAFFHRLRHILSLLMQLLFLMVLVFSLADPQWTGRRPQRTVIVLDVSGSMKAVDRQGRRRFDKAADHVSQIIRSMTTQDELAIITAGPEPEVVCGFTTHQRTLQDCLEQIRPTDAAAHVEKAVMAAKVLLREYAADDPAEAADATSGTAGGSHRTDQNPTARRTDKRSSAADRTSGENILGNILVLTDSTGPPNGSAGAETMRSSANESAANDSAANDSTNFGTDTNAQDLTAETPAAETPAADSATSSGSESASADVRYVEVGESRNNLALTMFQARRSFVSPADVQILAEVFNAADEPSECSVELSHEDRLLDVIPLSLQPNERRHLVLEETLPAGGILTAALTGSDGAALRDDGLASDDKAWAVISERRRIRVTLVTAGNWFLQQAFAAIDSVQLTVADSVPEKRFDRSVNDDAAPEVLVLHHTVPRPLPEGPLIVIQPDTASSLWTLDGNVADPLAGQQNSDHPLLKFVRLDNVLMPDAVRVRPLQPATELVASVAGEPLYTLFSRPSGDVLLLTVSVEQGDLPLRTAFPILLTNALNWFSGDVEDLQSSVTAGHTQQIPMHSVRRNAELQPHTDSARTTNDIVLTSPSGIRQMLPESSGVVSTGPLNETGIWQLSLPADPLGPENAKPAAESIVKLACNPPGPTESDLRRAAVSHRHHPQLSLSAGRPIWFVMVLAALIMITAEWWLFHRRWID